MANMVVFAFTVIEVSSESVHVATSSGRSVKEDIVNSGIGTLLLGNVVFTMLYEGSGVIDADLRTRQSVLKRPRSCNSVSWCWRRFKSGRSKV